MHGAVMPHQYQYQYQLSPAQSAQSLFVQALTEDWHEEGMQRTKHAEKQQARDLAEHRFICAGAAQHITICRS